MIQCKKQKIIGMPDMASRVFYSKMQGGIEWLH
nr:MAG TPA: hypothetical protein [Caudoviricetes sp.]